jgi:hypothetical protein
MLVAMDEDDTQNTATNFAITVISKEALGSLQRIVVTIT